MLSDHEGKICIEIIRLVVPAVKYAQKWSGKWFSEGNMYRCGPVDDPRRDNMQNMVLQMVQGEKYGQK